MSWWVNLIDKTQPPWCSYGKSLEEFEPEYDGDIPCPEPCYPTVAVENHAEGGTHAIGGTTEAALSVTYNYGRCFAEAWDGVGIKEALDGRRAEEVLEALKHGVRYLGIEQDDDYWATTNGNAGHTLAILLRWAEQHPHAVFHVS